MKKALFLLVFLLLASCAPAPLTLVPVDTLVALTMAAMPATATSTASPTIPATLTPLVIETVTPEINLSAPGAACIPADTLRARGIVTRVLDGDTIEVSVGYDVFIVKYIGVNAPAVSPEIEWQGAQAIGLNELLVSGKPVVLVMDMTDFDSQGQRLRYVLVDNVFANYEMVSKGFARAQPSSPDTACDATFQTAQTVAQASLSGVWAPTPVPTATITPLASITPTPGKTKAAVCDCKDDRNHSCKGYATQAQAQACYNYCIQIGVGAILEDQNRNGLVCEGLP